MKQPRKLQLRQLAVVCLPALALCMGAAAEDSGELTGGMGHRQFVSGCSNEQHYSGGYGLGGIRIEHKADSGDSAWQFGVAAGGSAQADSGTMRTDVAATAGAAAHTTVESQRDGVGRATVLATADHHWVGAGLGVAGFVRSNSMGGMVAGRARLGPKESCIRISVLDGGPTNSAQQLASIWGDVVSDELAGGIRLGLIVGAELTGNSGSGLSGVGPMGLAGIRIATGAASVQVAGMNDFDSSQPNYGVTASFGWTFSASEEAAPVHHTELPAETTASELPGPATPTESPAGSRLHRFD